MGSGGAVQQEAVTQGDLMLGEGLFKGSKQTTGREADVAPATKVGREAQLYMAAHTVPKPGALEAYPRSTPTGHTHPAPSELTRIGFLFC